MALISLTYGGVDAVDTIAASPPHPKDRARAPRSRAALHLLVLLEIFCICRRNCCKDRDAEKREEAKNRVTKKLSGIEGWVERLQRKSLLCWVLVQRDSSLTALFSAVVCFCLIPAVIRKSKLECITDTYFWHEFHFLPDSTSVNFLDQHAS